ncbi:hypothetical protein CROQUDRAFT_656998 [Cronartium quercuum f. sp. fusiforme G11]|uniref:Uncharacterized protein n=1 Tax=Cronartium quercuum f. sp. fusiforme G11 TaxID=708437 RepID=A0A9P6NMD3_9BASI|nr:hypothetical protein CROQUDRAFT_656998 [Cronartium quercuum f. sp. fusiforme G11]
MLPLVWSYTEIFKAVCDETYEAASNKRMYCGTHIKDRVSSYSYCDPSMCISGEHKPTGLNCEASDASKMDNHPCDTYNNARGDDGSPSCKSTIDGTVHVYVCNQVVYPYTCYHCTKE